MPLSSSDQYLKVLRSQKPCRHKVCCTAMALGHHFVQHREEIKIQKAVQCLDIVQHKEGPKIPQSQHSSSVSCFAVPPSSQSQHFLHCTQISCSSLLQIFSISDGKGVKKSPTRAYFTTQAGNSLPGWGCVAAAQGPRQAGGGYVLRVPTSFPHGTTQPWTHPAFTTHVCARGAPTHGLKA